VNIARAELGAVRLEELRFDNRYGRLPPDFYTRLSPTPLPEPYLVAFNVGAIIGTASWGRLSEAALGRRGAVTLAALLGVCAIPMYLGVDEPVTLWIGAFLMGACGCGIWGTRFSSSSTTKR